MSEHNPSAAGAPTAPEGAGTRVDPWARRRGNPWAWGVTATWLCAIVGYVIFRDALRAAALAELGPDNHNAGLELGYSMCILAAFVVVVVPCSIASLVVNIVDLVRLPDVADWVWAVRFLSILAAVIVPFVVFT